MLPELIKGYFCGLKECLDKISTKKIEQIIEIIEQAYRQNRQIFVMGNGGSASSAAHFACDINKGISLKLKKRFKVICLNDNIPTILAYANDLSYDDIFVEQMKNLLDAGDLVIAISASGNSKNVLKAVQFANEYGADTVGLTGFDGGKLAKTAKASLVIPVNDMQQVEDLHLVILHLLMRALSQKIKA